MSIDTKAIRGRAERATKGPWTPCHDGACSCGMIWSTPFDVCVAARIAARDETYTGGEGITDEAMLKANAQFIAHARTDVPALCDALDAATARAKKAETAFVGACERIGEQDAELTHRALEMDRWSDAAMSAATERDAARAELAQAKQEREQLRALLDDAHLAMGSHPPTTSWGRPDFMACVEWQELRLAMRRALDGIKKAT